jgi:hypothetical protein
VLLHSSHFFSLTRLVGLLLPLAEQYTIRQYTLRVGPFTIHMAWISAADFVNLNMYFVKRHYGSAAQFKIAVVSLILLFGFALACLWRAFFARRLGSDTLVAAVLAWPLLGIYVELGSPADSIVTTFTPTEIDVIRYAAAAGAIIIVVGVVVRNVLTMFGSGGNNGGAAAGASQQDVANSEEGANEIEQANNGGETNGFDPAIQGNWANGQA